MSLRRLRPGDLLAGLGGLLLLASLWTGWWSWSVPADISREVAASLADLLGRTDPESVIGSGAGARFLTGPADTVAGWDALTVLRWPLLLCALAGIAVPLVTAAQRSPALPLAAEVLSALLATAMTVCVAVRLLDTPGPDAVLGVAVGGWLALASVIVQGGGSWWGMRDQRSGTGAPGDDGAPPPARPAPPAGDEPAAV